MLNQKKIDQVIKLLDITCMKDCECIREEAEGCDCPTNKARLILLGEDVKEEDIC